MITVTCGGLGVCRMHAFVPVPSLRDGCDRELVGIRLAPSPRLEVSLLRSAMG